MNPESLRRKRKRLGLTQTELANLFDLTRLTIARYEIGVISIPRVVEMAMKLLESEHRK